MLPGQDLWPTVDLAGLVRRLLPQGDAVCLAGRTPAEAVVLVQASAAAAAALAKSLCQELNVRPGQLPVTVCWSGQCVPTQRVGEELTQLRRRLHTETRLFAPQLLDGAVAPVPQLAPDLVQDCRQSLGQHRTIHG